MATAESLATTETINGKRYYNIGEGIKYPSVTTILGAMTDKSGIDKIFNFIEDSIKEYQV